MVKVIQTNVPQPSHKPCGLTGLLGWRSVERARRAVERGSVEGLWIIHCSACVSFHVTDHLFSIIWEDGGYKKDTFQKPGWFLPLGGDGGSSPE